MSKALIAGYAAAMANLSTVVKSKEINDRLLVIADVLVHCLKSGGKIMIAGNGGSHCSALHFAEELTGRFRKDRPALGALAFGEATHATCTGNDYGIEHVFSRQVEGLGRKGDVLVLLSTSGNSPNLIRAAEYAHDMGIKTIGLLGRLGGRLWKDTDIPVNFPGETSDRIQEMHMLALHLLVELVERELFPENYYA